MKQPYHTLLLLAISLVVSCQRSEVYDVAVTDPVDQHFYIPGKACIKVTEELSQRLEAGEEPAGLAEVGVLKRTFSHGGRFEERMRRSGLHLWYDVEFDSSTPLTKAGESLMGIPGIEMVEYVPVVRSSESSHFFNDPDLRKQWHYTNAGNPLTGLVAGCDINVRPAWERGVVGSENVVVAVLDHGVDVNHEDLKDNIWQGTDPDGNPINGYNFVMGNYNIIPEDHGTHVAGTIAAVNNNAIGISGIAGGDASKGIKGVRIMSCQTMAGDNGGDEADAFVWAANNGAVIAQNSWGYLTEDGSDIGDTPRYVKDAIDYFNEFAGCDENGNQLPDSPMKGGIVVFAAGNESKPYGYPASYEGCIAVSSVAGDFKAASYTNHGKWVDIAAPGGESSKMHLVLSTVPGNSYDGYQGTSMACPHVSGVAALILSEFGGPGFTRDQLIERLLKTARDISLQPELMGAGLVDASAAVAHYGEVLPPAPEFAKAELTSGSSFNIKFIMPADNEGVECRSAELLYSSEPFTEITTSLQRIPITVSKVAVGDTLSVMLDKLALNSTYYCSAVGYDVFGNASALTENITLRTLDNQPPVIQALDGTEHTFKQFMQPRLQFNISDPENELGEVRYEEATAFETFYIEDGIYRIDIDAQKIPAGTYKSRIVASDVYGVEAECEITFTVEENNAPAASQPIENVLFNSKTKTKTVTLSEHFTDDDGETLKYSIQSSAESVAKGSVAKDVLTLTSIGYGMAQITVTASDALGKTASAVFNVVVRDGSNAYDLYPNPITDGRLYVRGAQADEVDVVISGASGTVVFDGKVNPDPFSPAVVDLTGITSGVYNVKVTSKSGKSFSQNVVKL